MGEMEFYQNCCLIPLDYLTLFGGEIEDELWKGQLQ
jgi:hypothetical protein